MFVPSLALTVLAPDVEDGTVNIPVNPPVELLSSARDVVATGDPSYSTVMLDVSKKPVPLIVTVFPVTPFTGVRVILVISLKLAVAESELESVAVTVLIPWLVGA